MTRPQAPAVRDRLDYTVRISTGGFEYAPVTVTATSIRAALIAAAARPISDYYPTPEDET